MEIETVSQLLSGYDNALFGSFFAVLPTSQDADIFQNCQKLTENKKRKTKKNTVPG